MLIRTRICAAVSVMVLASAPLSAQWRMDGGNPSRTGVSAAVGPTSTPTFTAIATVNGALKRIANDGSLILGGQVQQPSLLTPVSSYSSAGKPNWTAQVPSPDGFGVLDVAVGVDGTVYASTTQTVTALNASSGAAIWNPPNVVTSSGNESSALAIDANDEIYFHTGSNNLSAPSMLTAIDPTGKRKWAVQAGNRGYSRLVLSADQSTAYLISGKNVFGSPEGDIAAIATATGTIGPSTPASCDPLGDVYTFASSGVLYAGEANNNLTTFTEDVQTCSVLSAAGIIATGIAAITPANQIVLQQSNGSYGAITAVGGLLWTKSEQMLGGFADAAGNFFAIAPATNEIVARSIATGQEWWRASFPSPITGLALGPNGALYVTSGTQLLSTRQIAALQPAVIVVPGVFGTKLASSSEVVWLSNHVINDALLGNYNDLQQLEYDSSGHPVTQLSVHALVGDEDYGGLFNINSKTGDPEYALDCNTFALRHLPPQQCFSDFYVYNDLQNTLKAYGFAFDLFSYDWREDISIISEQLFTTIQAVAAAHPGQPIALIAHSMGGLVVGEALVRHGVALQSMLQSVITLGTPFGGAVETYLDFRGWSSISPILIPPSEMQVLGQNWSSAYELLPQQPFVSLAHFGIIPVTATYDGTYAPDLPRLPRAVGSNSALASAQTLWNDLSKLHPLRNGFGIVGSGTTTVSALVEPKAQIGCLVEVFSDGDGTVPLQSAKSSSWIKNLFYVNAAHGSLPSNSAVLEAILSILGGGQPSTLSSVPFGAPPGIPVCLGIP